MTRSVLRSAHAGDIPAIARIYGHYVEHTAATFDLEVPTDETWLARWEAACQAGHPWLVVEQDGLLAGYATASAHRPKAAYRSTVETTVYLAPEACGGGLGRTLYAALLNASAAEGLHLAVAGITLPNPASVALHETLGFTSVGVFEQIGHKLGAWRDVGWWQKRLE